MIYFYIDLGVSDHQITTDELFMNEIKLKDAINIGVAKEKHSMKSYKVENVDLISVVENNEIPCFAKKFLVYLMKNKSESLRLQ